MGPINYFAGNLLAYFKHYAKKQNIIIKKEHDNLSCFLNYKETKIRIFDTGLSTKDKVRYIINNNGMEARYRILNIGMCKGFGEVFSAIYKRWIMS